MCNYIPEYGMWFINRNFSAINICNYGLAVVYLHGEIWTLMKHISTRARMSRD